MPSNPPTGSGGGPAPSGGSGGAGAPSQPPRETPPTSLQPSAGLTSGRSASISAPIRQSSIPTANPLLSTINAARQRQPMCAECEKSLPNQIVFDKIENIIRQMQDEQNGLPVKTAKSFMSKIPSVFIGTDLIQWMMRNLRLEDQQEAIHLANLIASHGYIFPIEDHTLSIKNDCTFYRFQTPCLWPSNNSDPENTDYAVYLCKRTMQGKTRLELADYEAENLARLQKMFSRKWDFIFMQAESQAKVDKKRDKLERKVLDSQERAFWDVYRPVPGCVNTTELDIKKACRLSKSAKRCGECQKMGQPGASFLPAGPEGAGQAAGESCAKSVRLAAQAEEATPAPTPTKESGERKPASAPTGTEKTEAVGEPSQKRTASDTKSETDTQEAAPEGAPESREVIEAAKSGDAPQSAPGEEASRGQRQPAAGQKQHGHHHHHHHHHHHPHHQHGNHHHHHHHHHHRQCPHHKSQRGAAKAQPPEAGAGEQQAAPAQGRKAPAEDKRFVRAPSMGSAGASSAQARRKSECNRVFSVATDCGVSGELRREPAPAGQPPSESMPSSQPQQRPASTCCSQPAAGSGGPQRSPARSAQTSHSNPIRKGSLGGEPAPASGSVPGELRGSDRLLRSPVGHPQLHNHQHSPVKGSQSVSSSCCSPQPQPAGPSGGCSQAERQNIGKLERELEALKLRLDRRIGGVKMSKVTQSYLSYFKQWAEYDPFVAQPIPSNPWISDSTELWDSERQTKEVHCRRVRRWAFSLKELLNDPAGREQFHKFLEKEFSAENLKFWDAVQELKRVHARDVARRVEAIWTEYLAQER